VQEFGLGTEMMISFEWFKIERRENLKEINNALVGEVIPILV